MRRVSPPQFLPPAPWRGRESRLRGCRLIGPHHHRGAVLPLDRHRLVTDLEAALVDREITEQGLRLSLQHFLPYRVGVEAAGAPHGVEEQSTPRVRRGRVKGRRAAELPLIHCDELLVAGVRKA